MTTSFVTPQGLVIPSVEDIKTEIEADQRGTVDPNIDTDPDSPMGQINGIFASHIREVYEVLQVAYNGFNPDAAENQQLDGISAITGTTRLPTTPSTFHGTRQITVNLNAGVTLPAGSIAAQAGNPGVQFATDIDVTSAGAGDYSVPATCTQNGPIPCNANTLTVKVTPVVGWNSVNNPSDALLGRPDMTDPGLRQLRETELRATGAGTVDSIRADLLEIELPDGTFPVQDVTMFQNTTMATDANGLPPKSIEALVFDGVVPACPDTTIGQVLWDDKPAGIALYGGSSTTAVDKLGATQTVLFSRPTLRAVKFNVSLIVDATKYVGDQAVLTLLSTTFTSTVKQGKLIRSRVYIRALMGLAGVVDVPMFEPAFVGDAYTGVDEANLQLGVREMGTFNTTNVTLVTTPGVP